MRLRRTIALAILALGTVSVITWLLDPLGLRASQAGQPERPEPAATTFHTPASSAPASQGGAVTTPPGRSAPGGAPATATAGSGTFRNLPVVQATAGPVSSTSASSAPGPPPAASSEPASASVTGPSTSPGRVVRYALQAEDGVALDDQDVAEKVFATLNDPRGWRAVDKVTFEQIPGERSGEADMVIMLSSPTTTDRLCMPLRTHGEYSCQPRGTTRVVLNLRRWAIGVPWYADDLDLYRTMLVNHEVGHFLGHDHEQCPGPGRVAPIMQQQSISLGQCTRNAYPSVH